MAKPFTLAGGMKMQAIDKEVERAFTVIYGVCGFTIIVAIVMAVLGSAL